MSESERLRIQAKLRSLMAMTVANGCTAEEELAAARMVARMVEQLDGQPAAAPAVSAAEAARAERSSPQYQTLLEKNTLESLLKAALGELALGHINTVSPPSRDLSGEPVERVWTRDLVEPYLAMMLGIGGSAMAKGIIHRLIEELVMDGQLPKALSIPVGD